MLKLIFYLITISLFIVLFNEAIVDTTSMIAVAITSLSSAFTLILSIVVVPFTIMLDFYYIKLVLYIGLLIFTLSYILKWFTGHHLTTEEDIEDEKDPYSLSKKDIYDLQKNAENIKFYKQSNKTKDNKKEIVSDDFRKEVENWKNSIK